MDFGVSGQATKMRIPVAVDISRYPEESLKSLLRDEGILSIASTPILFKDRILGTINIHYMHPIYYRRMNWTFLLPSGMN